VNADGMSTDIKRPTIHTGRVYKPTISNMQWIDAMTNSSPFHHLRQSQWMLMVSMDTQRPTAPTDNSSE